MAMHPAYRTHCKPARRGLAAGICAVLLLLAGAALAHGTVAGADGSSAMPPSMLWAWGEMFVKVLLVFATPVAVALALNWGAQTLWQATFRTRPPFGLCSVAALLVSLMLAAVGVFVIPAFAQLYASFGAQLPWQTEMVMKYRHLLPVVFFLLLFTLYFLRKSARRERYFAFILAWELILIVLVVIAQYLPIFRVGEAV